MTNLKPGDEVAMLQAQLDSAQTELAAACAEVARLMERRTEWKDRATTIQRQRDELLAALRAILAAPEPGDRRAEAMTAARKLVASMPAPPQGGSE